MNKNKLLVRLYLLLVVTFTVQQSASAELCTISKLPISKLYAVTLTTTSDAFPIKYKMKILRKNAVGNYNLAITSFGTNDYGNKYLEELIANCQPQFEIFFTLPQATNLNTGSGSHPVIYEWKCYARITSIGQKVLQGTCTLNYPVPEIGSTIAETGTFVAISRRNK